MAFIEVKNVAIRGLAACVPSTVVCNRDIYDKKWSGYDNFVNTTGIAKHRNSSKEICSSDLCVAAAERLLSDLSWDRSEIEAIVFVSQTHDFYSVPATSCLIQERLRLKKECYTLDIALGCSGWVYGMSVISTLMAGGTIKKALLLAGDTPSKFCSPDDKSTFPLFGDAGTVTALEFCDATSPIRYAMYTDGSGYKAINIGSGGYRNPVASDSFLVKNHGEGRDRADIHLEMDGESVFVFGISKAPKAVKALTEHYSINLDDIDLFTFHQANLFMNEKIRNKLKLDESKVPYSLQEFGNTSCASIPLTLITRCADKLKNQKVKHIACGFGVGLSWGAMNFETDNIVVSDLLEL